MSKILVIDDNELIAKMLQETLHECGYDVHVARDAHEGYNEAIQFLPDLIILDVQLPDVAGFDLCKIIKNRAELHTVPIIMITGTARTSEEKVRGFQMGVDDYVLKPFDIPEFLERIRAVLRRSEGRRAAKAPISPETALPSTEDPKNSERLHVLHAMATTLLSPFDLPAKILAPGVSLTFLMAALGLCLGAFALSAGTDASMTLVALSVVGMWGLAVAVLVMASSIVGVHMSWKDGAGLMSLAASPLLLKLVGALITSLWTTLSPFYYSAGPNLFWTGAPAWAARLDIFELWCVFLVWLMVSRWPGSSKKKAWVVTLLVWGASLALVMAMGKAG